MERESKHMFVPCALSILGIGKYLMYGDILSLYHGKIRRLSLFTYTALKTIKYWVGNLMGFVLWHFWTRTCSAWDNFYGCEAESWQLTWKFWSPRLNYEIYFALATSWWQFQTLDMCQECRLWLSELPWSPPYSVEQSASSSVNRLI